MILNSILINISNHPSTRWSEEQKQGFDNIIDEQFPNIDPNISSIDIEPLVEEYFKRIKIIYENEKINDISKNILVMLMGEFTFCYILFQKIKAELPDIIFCIPTTQRVTVETPQPDGSIKKEAIFKFIKWRFI